MKVPKVRRLPSGNYRCRLRLGGEEISIIAATERECLSKARQVKADYLAGERASVACGATMKLLADRYVADRESVLSPSTVAGYKKIIKRYSHLHNRLPSSVRWQAEVNAAARKYAPKTVKNDFGFWGAVVRYAGLQMPDLRRPQIVQKDIIWLTPEQIPVFLDAIHGTRHELGALLALHGLRLSELLALEKGSVWGGQIYVRGAVVRGEHGLVEKPENKNAASRRAVPVMIPRLQELVDEAPDGKLYQYQPHTLYRAINRVCERAGLPKPGVHGLRHSFVSLCWHAGLSPLQTIALTGHGDIATMQRIYSHLSEADKKEGADLLRVFFAGKRPQNGHGKL